MKLQKAQMLCTATCGTFGLGESRFWEWGGVDHPYRGAFRVSEVKGSYYITPMPAFCIEFQDKTFLLERLLRCALGSPYANRNDGCR